MKIIVGLGNPGKEYENTRHNVGFLVLDKLQNKISNDESLISKENQGFQKSSKFDAEVCRVGEVLLVKPQTFMNDSGKSVAAVVNFYKIDLDDLWVVHDDLDIAFGEYKIQKGKGPKIHNGVNDIEEKLGSKDFWRLRLGVDSRDKKIQNPKSQILNNFKFFNFQNKNEEKIPGREYVLMKISSVERRVLDAKIDELVNDFVSRLV